MKPPRSSSSGPQPVQIEKEVSIEKPIYGGAFLARVEGKAVFVPLTLPGEQARIRIVEDKRGYASAEATEILCRPRGSQVPSLRRLRWMRLSARKL
jgi:tRNA/tmRNA/rRNA uracil-C5-methylase (TrmA/RlmC/RlmD family)